MHHGTANAICLPHVMAWNASRRPGLYQRVGIACGLDLARASAEAADRKTIDFLKGFITNLGVRNTLREFGVKESQIDLLATQAHADSCHLTNPVSAA
jgi:alcohol dehydrogenase class IV